MSPDCETLPFASNADAEVSGSAHGRLAFKYPRRHNPARDVGERIRLRNEDFEVLSDLGRGAFDRERDPAIVTIS
jgi:hypothetical protein